MQEVLTKNFLTKDFLDALKDIIPTASIVLGSIFTFFKSVSSFRQNKAIKHLELIKQYLSAEKLTQLDKEPKFIQYMTCNVFSYFWGFEYKEIKALIKTDIKNNNYFMFFNAYRKKWVDDKGNLTDLGKKKIGKLSYKKFGACTLFVLWSIGVTYILSVMFPLPSSISGWFILLITIGIPEFYLLTFLDERDNLNRLAIR